MSAAQTFEQAIEIVNDEQLAAEAREWVEQGVHPEHVLAWIKAEVTLEQAQRFTVADCTPSDWEDWDRNGFDLERALGWIESDFTIDTAKGWENHGCGPGDAAGCWTSDAEEAFAEPENDDADDGL